jgi:hypothetical protein
MEAVEIMNSELKVGNSKLRIWFYDFITGMKWFFDFKRKPKSGETSRYGYIYNILPHIHFCKVCGRGIKKRYMIYTRDIKVNGRYYCYECYKYLLDKRGSKIQRQLRKLRGNK